MSRRINLPQISGGKCQEKRPNRRDDPCYVGNHIYKPTSSYRKEGRPMVFPNWRPDGISGISLVRITKPSRMQIARRKANKRGTGANGTRLPRIRKQTLQLQSNLGIVTDSDGGGDKRCLRKQFKSTVVTKPETLPTRRRLLLPSIPESANKEPKPSRLVCSNCLNHSERRCAWEPQLSDKSVMSQRKSSVNNFSTALAQLSEYTVCQKMRMCFFKSYLVL